MCRYSPGCWDILDCQLTHLRYGNGVFLLCILWTAEVSNTPVLERIKPDLLLEGEIAKLRLTYFEQIMWSNSLKVSFLFEMVSGKWKPDRQRTCWFDTRANTSKNIKTDGTTLNSMGRASPSSCQESDTIEWLSSSSMVHSSSS